ncbi:MAG TPA: TIGR03087 family PEP-CTERM/XrtA system glycosyltransferase [Gammaproteobacteria bacterium]|nr:TIGR03087 family PEP-CTERM/XrtA system glycosyltransferase [Gammaproteobacteria bacterium]
MSQRVPYPPNKGEKLRTYHQMEHLLAKGHKVSVCTPAHNHEDEQSISSLHSATNVSTTFERMGRALPRLIKGLFTFKALSVSNFYSPGLQAKLEQLIKQENFDVILCTSSSMAEYIFKSNEIQLQLSSNQSIMLLMDFMDLDSDKWKQYSTSSSWPMKWVYSREARLLSQLEQKIQKTFAHCFFISRNEVDLFQASTGSAQNVHVLGNGIDNKSFYPAKKKLENTDPVFIFTGVMDYKPNVDAVLWFAQHAWEKIRKKYPQARFIIAGMNPSQPVKNLEHTSGIEVTGFVDNILPYYHQSDYFVAPFTIARGVQNKILQAFACGLPVIASSMGAEGIECIDGEHIIIAETTDEYLQAIDRLESEPLLKTAIKDAALKLIHDHYSWNGKLKVLDSFLA